VSTTEFNARVKVIVDVEEIDTTLGPEHGGGFMRQSMPGRMTATIEITPKGENWTYQFRVMEEPKVRTSSRKWKESRHAAPGPDRA
jgi:hypothetical protein